MRHESVHFMTNEKTSRQSHIDYCFDPFYISRITLTSFKTFLSVNLWS